MNGRRKYTSADQGALYRCLVDTSPDIIYMLDDAGRITFINRTAEALFGSDAAALDGKELVALVHREDRESVRRAIAGVDCGRQCLQVRLDAVGDKPVWIELSATPVHDADGLRLGTCGVIRDISHRKEAEDNVRHQAFHDILTGLPNRMLLADRLEQAMAHARRSRCRVALMYLDVDNFKRINDGLGHALGDELLKAVAVRLKECLRESDTVARVGGDEFVLLAGGINGAADARRVARKVVTALRRPFPLAGRAVSATASVGVAVYPDDGDCMEVLVRHADAAMYHIKAGGRDGYRFYGGGGKPSDTPARGAEIRQALERDEFCLHYQPEVNIRSRDVVGLEALVRWKHPSRGLLPAALFIAEAEETGAIVPLGRWVMERVLADIAAWRAAGLLPPKVAVNLSALEFEQDALFREIVALTAAAGGMQGALEVEISEDVILKDADGVVERLMLLKERGISVAVDDFGTGHSSLSHLHRLPIDALKIDRSFVRDIDAGGGTLVNAIVAMARGLGMNVIAEGVESAMQIEYLLERECDVMQGFLIGRPMAAGDAGRLFTPPPSRVASVRRADAVAR